MHEHAALVAIVLVWRGIRVGTEFERVQGHIDLRGARGGEQGRVGIGNAVGQRRGPWRLDGRCVCAEQVALAQSALLTRIGGKQGIHAARRHGQGSHRRNEQPVDHDGGDAHIRAERCAKHAQRQRADADDEDNECTRQAVTEKQFIFAGEMTGAGQRTAQGRGQPEPLGHLRPRLVPDQRQGKNRPDPP